MNGDFMSGIVAPPMHPVRAVVQAKTTRLPGIDGQLVLCWVGSTEERDPVVDLGRTLAADSGGRCHVVVVLGVGGEVSHPGVVVPQTPETISRANRRLQKLYGEDVAAMALPGHCISEIRRYAINHQATLIVMGEQALAVERAHGERLHEQAPCAVLIVVPATYRNPTGSRSNDSHSRRE
jgi:nucleotide-binding universal stress UspA family protein